MDIVEGHDHMINNILNGQINFQVMQRKFGTLHIPEILDVINKQPNKLRKKQLMGFFGKNKAFLEILRITYDPDIKFVIGFKAFDAMKYDPMDISDFDLAPTSLLREGTNLIRFTNFGSPVMDKKKAIDIISSLCSAMHPRDVKVLRQIIKKKLEVSQLTLRMVQEVFPGLITTNIKGKK